MDISQKLLGLMFAVSAASGAGLGLLFNVIHLLRAVFGATLSRAPSQVPPGETDTAHARRHMNPVSAFILFWLDLLFGLAGALVLILLLYYNNDGQFRLLAVFGMGCGFFAYYHTLGKLILRLTDFIVSVLRKLIRKLLHLLSVPPRLLGRLLDRVIGQPIRKRAEARRQIRAEARTNAWFESKIREAADGFGLFAANEHEDSAQGTQEMKTRK